MTIERQIRAIAGSVVLTGLALAYLVDGHWLWLSAFAGANLLQSAFTGWCPMEQLLRSRAVAAKR